jgi:hypothetical protein
VREIKTSRQLAQYLEENPLRKKRRGKRA